MPTQQKPIRVVHVEDSDGWRMIIGSMMENGLKRDNVVFESRPDFSQLNKEIASDNPDDLPDVLVLDNEAPYGEGALVAQEAKRKAQEMGREVVIIQLLCSSPSAVRQEYGQVLDEMSIPICDKLMHAPLVGFYIGSCVTDQGLKPLSFNDWLKQEEIKLPDDNTRYDLVTASRDVQNSLMMEIENSPGSLYRRPRDFIQEHRTAITKFMKPETIAQIEGIFPPLLPGGERR